MNRRDFFRGSASLAAIAAIAHLSMLAEHRDPDVPHDSLSGRSVADEQMEALYAQMDWYCPCALVGPNPDPKRSYNGLVKACPECGRLRPPPSPLMLKGYALP